MAQSHGKWQCQERSSRLGGRSSMIDDERKATQSCTFNKGFARLCMRRGRTVFLAQVRRSCDRSDDVRRTMGYRTLQPFAGVELSYSVILTSSRHVAYGYWKGHRSLEAWNSVFVAGCLVLACPFWTFDEIPGYVGRTLSRLST